MADVGLEQIEAAAIALVKSKWPAGAKPVKDFDVAAEPVNIATPGIYAAASYQSIVRVAHDLYKGAIKLSIIVLDANLAGQKQRRAGAHALVLAVLQLLQAQNLGLAIKPLIPTGAPEVTDSELRAAQKLGFRIDFGTEADITAASDEEAADLVTIAASYYLTPDAAGTDAPADAEDDIALNS
jgi:hypothetical protein